MAYPITLSLDIFLTTMNLYYIGMYCTQKDYALIPVILSTSSSTINTGTITGCMVESHLPVMTWKSWNAWITYK